MNTTQERVNAKKKEFFEQLSNLNLSKSTIEEIEELSESMQLANILHEQELALTFKNKIKDLILQDLNK